jgi:hypothetical protein
LGVIRPHCSKMSPTSGQFTATANEGRLAGRRQSKQLRKDVPIHLFGDAIGVP